MLLDNKLNLFIEIPTIKKIKEMLTIIFKAIDKKFENKILS
jgi:hypothetical protein